MKQISVAELLLEIGEFHARAMDGLKGRLQMRENTIQELSELKARQEKTIQGLLNEIKRLSGAGPLLNELTEKVDSLQSLATHYEKEALQYGNESRKLREQVERLENALRKKTTAARKTAKKK